MSSYARQISLATLDAFLDSQRQLISRTQADIQKLTILREKALKDPVSFVENVDDELDDVAFKISEHEPPRMPSNIDWSLYNLIDPSRFPKLTIPGSLSPSDQNKRKPTPSNLQTFVREAAENILGNFKPYVPPPDPDEDEEDTEAANEQRLVELVNAGRTKQLPNKPVPPRCRIRSGLRLFHENDNPDAGSRGDSGNNASTNSPVDSIPQVRSRPQRIRRPTLRAEQAYHRRPQSPVTTAPIPLRIRIPPLHTLLPPLTDPVNDGLSDVTSSDIPVATPPQEEEESIREDNSRSRRRSVHSETFNKPWSPTEQRLLEKLLEEIPHGEKNRWSQISKAMSGKRTPRQVASRVQKYFEKLKRFGVDPDT